MHVNRKKTRRIHLSLVFGLLYFIIMSLAVQSALIYIDNENYGNENSSEMIIDLIPKLSTTSWVDGGNVISNAAGNQRDAQICGDQNGGAIMAWIDYRGPDADIYAQRIDSDGITRWTVNGVPICTESGDQDEVQIISDDSGGAIIVWKDKRNDTGDIYAQKIDSDGLIQWSAGGKPICTYSGDQIEPQICNDVSGGAFITWNDGRDFGTLGYDIYAQRIDTNANILWEANGTVICNATNNQIKPHLCLSDGPIITWQDLRNDDGDIYAQRMWPHGEPVWGDNGIAICNATETQQNPQICAREVENEGAFITWEDSRDSNYDIYAQWINNTGHEQWNSNGTPICVVDCDQTDVQICGDEPGGAIITWRDYRTDGANIDIYAQRILPNESIVWTGNGTDISTSSLPSYDFDISCDDNGVIIAWEQQGTNDKEIYAQRILLNGTIPWTADGVAICTRSSDQLKPKVCSDEIVGAIIIWKDERSGVGDIYAQMILFDGSMTLASPGGGIPLEVILLMIGLIGLAIGSVLGTAIVRKRRHSRSSYALIEEMHLEIKRGGDWDIEGDQSIFKYKVKVHNSSDVILSNIQILLTSIPRSLEVDSDRYKIELLRPDSYESPTFKLKARESCVGDVIEGVISYIDPRGTQHTETIEPFKIEYVCNLLTPKQVTEAEYTQKIASMGKREIGIDSDLTPDDLEKEISSILKNNNFYLLDTATQPFESETREIKGYAEGKYDKEDVGLSVVMQQMADQTTSMVIKAMSEREEKLIDLLRDLNIKCDDIKSCNELILEYSMKIEQVIDQIENLEEFLMKRLGGEFQRIKHIWTKYKNGKIDKKGLITEGAQVLGKRFLKLFLGKVL